MKPLYMIFLLAALALGACTPQTTVDDVPDHQPANPKTWSPAGKIYVCHDTYENSPAEDKYWAWVLNFFTEDSLVRYETPNRDLSYHDFTAHIIDSLRISVDYPTISYKNGGYNITLTYKDTLTIVDAGNNVTYSLIF